VAAEYGQKKPSDPGAAFSLSPGETKKELLFRLIPAAVIAGRVFDEDGETVPNAMVLASRETYYEGRRTLTITADTSTDDLGCFRLFGLAPGRYYVSAKQQQWGQVVGDREFSGSAGQTTEQGYAKTYYPGTPDISRAAAINVKRETKSGTDIALKQVAVHRVRGRVLVVTHKPGQDGGHAFREQSGWTGMGGQRGEKADGSFEIPDVVQPLRCRYQFDQTEGKITARRKA
jgi:hypothetical protein